MGDRWLRQTTQDLGQYQQYVIGSSIESLRLGMARVNRDLVTQNRLLVIYKANYNLLVAKALNNVSLLDIEIRNTPDTFEEPLQAMDNSGAPPPSAHQNYGIDKAMIKRTQDGINARDAELNKAYHDVLLCMAKIRGLNKYRETVTEDLRQASLSQRQTPTILRGLLPDQPLLPPVFSDTNKDRIAKSRPENIYLLYQLHIDYVDYSKTVRSTIDPKGPPVRGYPDEEKLDRNLIVLREVFAAHAKGFPNNEFFQTTPALNLADPGDPVNGQILRSKLAVERATSASIAVPEQIRNYVQELSALAMDPSTSKGISRRQKGGISAKDSMSRATQTYPVAVMRLGEYYEGSFEIPSFYEAVSKWYKRDKSKNFKDLPMCSVLPNQTITDVRQASQTASKAFDEAEGRGKYKKIRKEVATSEKTEAELSTVKLPDAAPQWVKDFVKLYGIGVDVESRQMGSKAIYTGSAYTNATSAQAAGESGEKKATNLAEQNLRLSYGEALIPTNAVFVLYAFTSDEGTCFGYAQYEGTVFEAKAIPGNVASEDGFKPEVKTNLAEMRAAFKRLATQKGLKITDINLTSGFRTYDLQLQMFEDAVIKYGSEEEARHWVADPRRTTSKHQLGLAFDIDRSVANVLADPNAFPELNGKSLLQIYGFTRPLLDAKRPEAWHIEWRP